MIINNTVLKDLRRSSYHLDHRSVLQSSYFGKNQVSTAKRQNDYFHYCLLYTLWLSSSYKRRRMFKYHSRYRKTFKEDPIRIDQSSTGCQLLLKVCQGRGISCFELGNHKDLNILSQHCMKGRPVIAVDLNEMRITSYSSWSFKCTVLEVDCGHLLSFMSYSRQKWS